MNFDPMYIWDNSPTDDYCRVVLSYPDGTDYINAAFIDVSEKNSSTYT